MNNTKAAVRFILISTAIILFFASPTLSQSRDPLTDAESDLLRYHQELDKRIEVLIKAADRRFAIINGTSLPSTKKLDKEEPDWGEVPKGTRTELLGDIAGILDEAINKIDDVSLRDQKNSSPSKSLRKLAEAARRYLTMLEMKNRVTGPDENAAITRVADNANQIIEAESKLSPASEETPKKKKP